jgi:LytS/YehU family sensor histidine kinase
MWFFDSFVCKIPNTSKGALMASSVIIGMLITIIILSIEIGSQFFTNWKRSLVEVEKYRTESVQAQLQNLKTQVNPHFLFNNLSVLSSLVYKDQDKAVDFINQLSKVYRYLLDTRNSELITLDEELKFIESYTYLLQIRFDKNLEFRIDIPASRRHLLIPPMSLQMLIENAIKHNEVSSDLPLRISITEYEEMLEVKNNLQPRTNAEASSNTGLKNIKDRYAYYTSNLVEIEKNTHYFVVRIPLLHKG